MPFKIIRNDITKVKADVIVNTANPYPTYAGATDRDIYMAAGAEKLLAERSEIGFITFGDIAVTNAYDLDARYIIHAVGPVWQGGNNGERELLKSCISKSLNKATELNCESIAFPLISAGVYGFPKQEAIRIFTDTIYDFLMHSDMLVLLVLYDKESFELSEKIFGELDDYLEPDGILGDFIYSAKIPFTEVIKKTEMSFHDYLLQLMIESDLSNPDIYRGANITKQHFSKILSNKGSTPSKNTICALAISLSLDIDQTELLLSKAGYALTDSKPFDIAVRYFIENEMYDIFYDNILLFDNDLEQLGTITE